MVQQPVAILFTQCLQNDFVKPIGRYDPIPNRLHIGYSEARRLVGADPAEGPLGRMMEWASQVPAQALAIIHIRDWHEADDPHQRNHLQQFGHHCLAGSEGAELVFSEPGGSNRPLAEIRSQGLNDFIGTNLAEVLAPFAGRPVKAGIVGVWTEAKVSFLAYELRSRFPDMELAVCSALTASSSRAHHFIALDQLERVLGVEVFTAVGDFMEHLAAGTARTFSPAAVKQRHPVISNQDEVALGEVDEALLRYLFRSCKELQLKVLDGGYSGNVVVGTESIDLYGHVEVPHVVKIGPRQPIGQERAAFERIEQVLGNCAPGVADFADLEDRGAIKYRYASMGGAFSSTFQKLYMQGIPQPQVERILHTVFAEQLGRLYAAARRERLDLLDYYEFDRKWAPGVRRRVEDLLGAPATGESLELAPGVEVPNLCLFYERDLGELPRLQGSPYLSFVHGDLNGANIVIDGSDNVWLIDFFHTHRGHVLRDLIKLENDLLYIFTPVSGSDDLQDAFRLTDLLLALEDLAQPLPEVAGSGLHGPQFQRALATIRYLRSFYPGLIHADRDPLQLWIAMLRYAAHTIGFGEPSRQQRRWALYTACRCAGRISESLRARGPLRIDRLDRRHTGPGRLGITICPGRRDLGRSLDQDLATLEDQGVSHVVCLVPEEELARYGVPELLAAYAAAGIELYHLPIVDQKRCSNQDMQSAVDWIEARLQAGAEVLVHCIGGLGRSGMVAGCFLKSRGATSEEAIREVRRTRTERAIETPIQEEMVEGFYYQPGGAGTR
jgi:protein-tyrosine phosphatase